MQKQTISKEDYQKEIEKTFEFIRYFEYKDEAEAMRLARNEVSQKYIRG